MFKHDFYAVGDCGHRRNFIYIHGKKKKLKHVVDMCGICNYRKTKYKVLKYWEEPVEVEG